jgi:hypothetical protein
MQPFKFKYGNKVLKGPKGTQLYRVAGGTECLVGTTFAYEVRCCSQKVPHPHNS